MTYNPTLSATSTRLLRYQQIRQWTPRICGPLAPEDYVVQPIVDVSPPKWHLGHTTWFFENFILQEHLADYQLFDERLNWFFNSYYESQGPRILRTNRGNMTRPSTERVMAYRAYVDEHMEHWMQQYGDGELPGELAQLLEVGLQHEQQHQELLVTDLKYILGHNPLYPVYQEGKLPEGTAPEAMQWMEVKEGLYEVGYEGEGFCWDNELSRHQMYLYDYSIAKRLVTNGEYLEFMQAGGYEGFEYWQMEGLEWARSLEVKAPLYWYEKEGEWFQYSLRGLRPLDLAAPVTHISFFEADAYARWKCLRLPTEQEWEVACALQYDDIPTSANLLDEGHFHPIAPQKADDTQFLGNVWEWTNSAYLPYPNYPRFKGALGEYNGKFMINQMVLRGGSCATPRSHIRSTYRNFFHTDKRWQFTGIRLAR